MILILGLQPRFTIGFGDTARLVLDWSSFDRSRGYLVDHAVNDQIDVAPVLLDTLGLHKSLYSS